MSGSETEIICVLGMHRSGTSLAARLVNLLGFSLGPPEKLLCARPDNPKGFWEYEPFVEIDDEILTRLGGSWHEPPRFAPGWETAPELADLRRRARALIEADFPRTGWVWKDPRACLTLAFWGRLLPPLRLVLCLRNPLDVAQSLARRNSFPLEKSVRLWHLYTTSCLGQAAGRPSLVVSYEDLLCRPREETARLARFLGRPELDEAVVRDFVSPELQHHRTSPLNGVDEPELPFPAKALYVALHLLQDARRGAAPAQSAELKAEDQELLSLLGRYSLQAQDRLEEALRKQAADREQAEALRHRLQALEAQSGEQEHQLAARAEVVGKLQSDVAERDSALGSLRAAVEQLLQQKQALEDNALALQNEARQRAAAAHELAQALARREAAFRELEADRDRRAAEAGQALGQLRDRVAGQERDLAARAEELARLRSELAHRDAAAAELRGQLGQQASLAAQLGPQKQTLEAAVAALQAQLAQQTGLAEQLGQQKQALELTVAAARAELQEKAKEEAEELGRRASALRDLARRAADGERVVQELQAQLADRTREVGVREGMLEALQSELDKTIAANQELAEELRDRNHALDALRSALDARRARLRRYRRAPGGGVADPSATGRAPAATRPEGRPAEASGELGRLAALVGEVSAREQSLGAELAAARGQLAAHTEELAAAREKLQSWIDYFKLVQRVREDVRRSLPADAAVLVASKGDGELLELGGRTGWHFPQDEAGSYAGHHPATGADAVSQLEALRGKGAQFFLLPSTAFWWLDHYRELAHHLDSHYPCVLESPNCRIYKLAATPAAPRAPADTARANGTGETHCVPPAAAAGAQPKTMPAADRAPRPARAGRVRMPYAAYRELVNRVRAQAEAVLPEGVPVIVVSKGDEELLRLGGRVAWHFPQTERGGYAGQYPADGADAIRQLQALRSRGGRCLLIPGTASWWLDHYEGLRQHLQENARCLWSSADCTVYQFHGAAPGKDGAPGPKLQPTIRDLQSPDPVAAVLAERPLDRYDAWLEVNRWNERRAADLRRRLERLPTRPLLSVVMPVYNPSPGLLDRAIRSVHGQLYDHWELCVADDASSNPEVRRLLEEWAGRDARIRVCFRPDNGNISRASNSAAQLSRGDFLAFLDHDDELEPDALGEVAVYLAAHPETDIVYTDDDKIDEGGRRFAPQFKPDWSPELLLSYMYLSHLLVMRRSLYWRTGGMRLGLEGSQDYDLVLRASERTCAVGHIPKVLYHWRVVPESTASSGAAKPGSFQSGRRAVQEAFERRRVTARAVQPEWAVKAGCGIFEAVFPDDGPAVAVLIPTRDNPAALRLCLESLGKTTYRNYQVVILDNESTDPACLDYLRRQPHRVLRVPNPGGKFNFAAINNRAAEQVEADLLLFLNDDTEVRTPCWLSQMVGHLRLAGVGAVGARLLYPDGRVQHAGAVHGYWNGQVGHAFKGLAGHDTGYLGYARVARNVSAVTGACLLTRRETFLALGGFDAETFGVAYNDIDYCHRLRARGLRVVYCPAAELVHHEGHSRGFVDDPAELASYLKKTRGMADPYYSIHLSRDDEFFRVASRTGEPDRPPPIPTLMCSHNLNWEGAPNSQLELTLWLTKNGVIDPVVYSPYDGPLRQAYEKHGIRVVVSEHPTAGLRALSRYDEAIARFARFIRESRVEFVYGNTLETFFAIDAARAAAVPSVWNPRESEPWQNYFSERYGPDIALRALRCFHYPYKVVFVSNATRAGYGPLEARHNFHTIHNGLDRGRVEEALGRWPRAAARERLGVPEDAVVFLILGTVCERKGQLDLLQAYARLDAGLAARVHCLIVGDRDNDYSRRLHAGRQALDPARRAHVHIVPENPEVGLYYAAGDVFVCASRVESFPRVTLEAMACRLPIVTTPVFGIPEQVRQNVNALFYQPGDITALAEALRRLVADPDLRRRLAANSVPVLETINDYPTMAAAYGRIFREAWLSGGARQRREEG